MIKIITHITLDLRITYKMIINKNIVIKNNLKRLKSDNKITYLYKKCFLNIKN